MVIARTCPDEQPLPMDAEARQEKLRYTQLHAQIKWTSAPIMDIEHRVSVAGTKGNGGIYAQIDLFDPPANRRANV